LEAHFQPELTRIAVTTIGMTNIGTAIAKAIGTATKDTGKLTATTIHSSKPDP
jgi:hypothetical protein